MIIQFDRDSIQSEDFIEFYGLYKKFREVFTENNGGMSAPDLFSFWYTLRKLQPALIIESGVWRGATTWIIRNTLPNSRIICLDVLDVKGFVDTSKLTSYFVGSKFVDFEHISIPTDKDKEKVLAFFDDHQNMITRISQSYAKGIKSCFFNDNYPIGCGSHISLSHVIEEDSRIDADTLQSYKNQLNDTLKEYQIFPNIIGNISKTGEGDFKTNTLFETPEEFKNKHRNTEVTYTYPGIHVNNVDYGAHIFTNHSTRYRWNTLVNLK